jgi:hypothetical protein
MGTAGRHELRRIAVSLTFGGAKVYGRGFGIPLVVRYLPGSRGDGVGGPDRAEPDPGFHVL